MKLNNITKDWILVIGLAVFLFFSISILYAFTTISVLNNKIEKSNENYTEIKHAIYYAHQQPTYKFIKDSTVYMFRVLDVVDDKANGYAGTGIVVEKKDGWTYILTNRHVCDKMSLDSCYTIINDKFIKLENVKVSTEENTDLSLWKTNVDIKKNKIKGIADSIGIGERGYSVGNFMGFKMMYTEGVYVGYYWDSDVYNMNIAGGCSGSAILNRDGYLIGVVFAGIGKPTSPKALTVPTKNIKEFLKNTY